MRHGGQAQRYRQPTLETVGPEEELKAVTDAVAAGVVTPAPGSRAPMTPGIATAAPFDFGAHFQYTKAEKSGRRDEQDEPELKKLDTETSPRRGHEKRENEENMEEESEKKQKIEVEGE